MEVDEEEEEEKHVNGEDNRLMTIEYSDLQILQVKELKNMIRERGLSLKGNKAQLIETLYEERKRLLSSSSSSSSSQKTDNTNGHI